ncbi:MAG: hypothetical protein AAGG65_18975 [Pseudomonadota bacterium]
MMPRVAGIAGTLAAIAMIAMAPPAISQTSGVFAPPVVSGGLAGVAPGDGFGEGLADGRLDGLDSIQSTDPFSAEARRKGLVSGLSLAMELFIDRPRDLLVIGIIGNFDNNISTLPNNLSLGRRP